MQTTEPGTFAKDDMTKIEHQHHVAANGTSDEYGTDALQVHICG